MAEENISQQFRLRNSFLEEIEENELMSKKHEKVCLDFKITGCI